MNKFSNSTLSIWGMVKTLFFALVLFFAYLPFMHGAFAERITIYLTAPDSTAATDTIHVVGNFNDWQTSGMGAVQAKKSGNYYVASIPNSQEPIFYTFLKNKSWQHAPAQAYGKGMCTFAFDPQATGTRIDAKFPAWGGDKPTEAIRSSMVGNIEILDDIMIPQLQRNRTIRVYLPPSYANGNRSYPVLYMLDGQNVFDRKTSYSGEWQVDEALERLFAKQGQKEFIVVAVDNGPKRMSEYSPWPFVYGDTHFHAEGKPMMDFIVETLKPQINQRYRTLQQSQYTGLAGASLGGMMAIYGAMEYAQHFGFVAAFSPSLSIHNSDGVNVLFNGLKQTTKIKNVVVYADMGLAEYGDYDKMNDFVALLQQKVSDQADLHIVKDDLGRHCEASWAERFPAAIGYFLP